VVTKLVPPLRQTFAEAALVLAQQYRLGWLLLAMLPGSLLMTVWLLIKGVDLPKWEEKTARSNL